MTHFGKLENRYVLACRFLSLDSLHIGSGREGDASDAAVMLRDNRPFIPGSSLRGAVRSHVERLLRAIFSPPRTCISFPEPPDELSAKICLAGNTDARKPYERGDDRAKQISAEILSGNLRLCPICRLFGSTLMASRIKFSDALQTCPENEVKHPVLRHGVAIDRDTESARDKLKFTYDLIDPNAAFTATITLENAGSTDFALLYIILSELRRGLPVGAKRNQGLGRLRLENYTVEFFDNNRGYPLLKFLQSGTFTTMKPRSSATFSKPNSLLS